MPGVWSNRWIQLTIRFGILALLLVAYRAFVATGKVDFSFDLFLFAIFVAILLVGLAVYSWPYLRERAHARRHRKQFKKANAAIEKADYDTAVDYYRRYLDCPICDYCEWVRLAVGISRQLQGKYSEAMAEFEFARQQDPNSPEPMKRLAYLLACAPLDELRDGPRAVALAREAGKLGNDADCAAFSILAAAEAENGQFDEAVATYQKAMSLMPEALRIARLSSLERLQAGKPLRCNREFDRSRFHAAQAET